MGIKGIYGEIGAGRRVALAKLNADKIAEAERPLRIAIDISIWLFQVQSSAGGANPALRTLYYRLVRILGLNIHPLFVFDGADRPPFKRNAATGNGGQIISRQARRLLDLFNFPYRIAPGEAEAECAALQRHGVVDYVLSEDVDTLAFGCTATMRNWSSINERSRGAPTHVTTFEAESIKKGKSGLDSEGMILVALMSGGDYLPAGVPRCGIKLACEAARAGFGHDLCQLALDDDNGFHEWRERLRHELITNESGFFRTKHKALQIPDDFPDRTVLNYHAHPSVSSAEDIQMLKEHLEWGGDLDIRGLREYLDETFEWKHLSGAKKFLRNIAPSVLSYRLYKQPELRGANIGLEEQIEREDRLIVSIMARRIHISTDGVPEIKVSYTPALVVGLDLDNELEEDDEPEESSEEEGPEMPDGQRSRSTSPVKRSRLKEFDPWKPRQTWVTEQLLKLGAPLALERWEAAMRDPRVPASRKGNAWGMQQGALENYLRVTKPGQSHNGHAKGMSDPYEEKVQRNNVIAQSNAALAALNQKKSSKPSRSRTKPKIAAVVDNRLNPWTIAKRDGETHDEDMELEQYGQDGSMNMQMRKDDLTNRKMNGLSKLSVEASRRTHRNAPLAINISQLPVRTQAATVPHGSSFISSIGISVTEKVQGVTATPVALNSGKDSAQGPKLALLDDPLVAAPVKSTKNYNRSSVVVRESLEGTWKLSEDLDSLSITPRQQYANVDILDLTDV